LQLGKITIGFVVCIAVSTAAIVFAQAPGPAGNGVNPQAPAGGRAARGANGTGNAASLARPAADPVIVERGKQLFSVNCSFCHGLDARGGEGGPNLMRSQIVLDDQHGEGIAPVVQSGRADKGMPSFTLSAGDVSDIATYLHSLNVGRGGGPSAPLNILVGDARTGQAYFNGAGKCNTCHSVTGDLAGIGSKLEPKALQNALVAGRAGGGRGAPSTAPPTKVKVTLPSGEVIEGKLDRIDYFDVSLTEANGARRTFSRNGDIPKVEVTNPLQAHLDLLKVYTDDDIHNLTAYLVTLK
jgi:cytochrome c oxidase cbb3-type subunit 3